MNVHWLLAIFVIFERAIDQETYGRGDSGVVLGIGKVRLRIFT